MRTTISLILSSFLLLANSFSQSQKTVQKWVDSNDWTSITKKAKKPKMAEMIVSTPFIWMENNELTTLSLLEHAIQLQQNETVKKLLIKGNPDATSKERWHPLLTAVRIGNLEAVQLLWDAGASFDVQVDNREQGADEYAAMYGRVEILRLLLDKGLISRHINYTAQKAIEYKQLDCLKLLLEKGLAASPLKESDVPISLIKIAIESDNLEALQILLEHKANPNELDENESAVISLAAGSGYADIVELLLKYGADANGKLHNGNPAILEAAERNNKEVVDLLAKYGADTTVKTKEGRSIEDLLTYPVIFRMAEEMPRFPGCENETGDAEAKRKCAEKKMFQFIAGNVRYPQMAKEAGFEGTALIHFVVMEDGTITNITIEKDPGGGIGKEAARVVGLMNDMPEKWIPGNQRGKTVNTRYALPIKFNLND